MPPESDLLFLNPLDQDRRLKAHTSESSRPRGSNPALLLASLDLGPLTYKPSGLSDLSLPQPSPSGVGSEPGGTGRRLLRGSASANGNLPARCAGSAGGRGGGAPAAVTAPRRRGPGKPAVRGALAAFPTQRAGRARQPASCSRGPGRREGAEGPGAWQAWFLAFSPRFLSRTAGGWDPAQTSFPGSAARKSRPC